MKKKNIHLQILQTSKALRRILLCTRGHLGRETLLLSYLEEAGRQSNARRASRVLHELLEQCTGIGRGRLVVLALVAAVGDAMRQFVKVAERGLLCLRLLLHRGLVLGEGLAPHSALGLAIRKYFNMVQQRK